MTPITDALPIDNLVMRCNGCGRDYAAAVNGRCPCGSGAWSGTGQCSAWMPFTGRWPTMGQAHLTEVERALEQAQACLLGDTPETMTHDEARADTLEKVRHALTNHVPSLRSRVT